MNRPTHLNDADWAEYQQCQAEHDDLVEQVADREAQLENDRIAAYDEYELDFGPAPTNTRATPPPRLPPALRRSRRR
ncbi:hypothetical protein ACFUEM_25110 [Streptomyces anulatus]|uniref:hypothetical protein n=1 Tax=Streptomyces anulatus TaxID=1892 RepID=UPI0035DED694